MNEMTTTPKHFCFVLMPFAAEFDDVYKIGIKEACAAAGAYCERVDEQIFHESMLDRIYNQISKADLIIADMTGRNANVFYEVGYAHALGKRTVLLTKNSDDIPFDLKHFPHVIYGNSVANLREEVTRRVKWSVEHASSQSQGTIGLELYCGIRNLASGDVTFTSAPDYHPAVQITILNATTSVIEIDDFHIGVILDNSVCLHRRKDERMTLPDGDIVTMLSEFGRLLPEASTAIELVFDGVSSSDALKRPFDVRLRLFTKDGSRDFCIQFVPPAK